MSYLNTNDDNDPSSSIVERVKRKWNEGNYEP